MTITRAVPRRLFVVPSSSSEASSETATRWVAHADRAAASVRVYCAANRLDKKVGLSFRGTPPDRAEALYRWRRFLERLQADQGPLPVAGVLERGYRGTERLHLHAVLGPWIPKAHLTELWGHGWVDIGRLGSTLRNEAGTLDYGYLNKYLHKAGDAEQLERDVRRPGEKRWFHTRGFTPVEFRANFRTPAAALAFAERHMGPAKRVFAYGGEADTPLKGWWVRFPQTRWWAPPRYAEAMRGERPRGLADELVADQLAEGDD
jgi:hypothetical protein